MLKFLLLAITTMLSLALYLAPALVARYRGHRQTLAITVLDVVGGWSLIGWVVALVWACTADVDQAASWKGRRDAAQSELEAAATKLRERREE